MIGRPWSKKKVARHRIIGALLLVFVFFLPLHFHPAHENQQISHECSCYLMGRTDLGLSPSLFILLFAPKVSFIIVSKAESLISRIVESEAARAPPFDLS
jgi:hypothetical protein